MPFHWIYFSPRTCYNFVSTKTFFSPSIMPFWSPGSCSNSTVVSEEHVPSVFRNPRTSPVSKQPEKWKTKPLLSLPPLGWHCSHQLQAGFLLGLFLDLQKEGDNLIRNVCWLPMDLEAAILQIIRLIMITAWERRFLPVVCLHSLPNARDNFAH
jgi:hypothetical protein